MSTQSVEDASKAHSRKRGHRIVEQELDRRVARALSVVQMGEISSGTHWKVLLRHQEHDRSWRHCVIQSVDCLCPETHSHTLW